MSNEAMVNNLTNILNGLDDSQEKLEKMHLMLLIRQIHLLIWLRKACQV